MPDQPKAPAPASEPAPKKLPRKPGRPSRWAKSFVDLGQRLVPPRERKTLQRALRHLSLPAACKRKADGRYDVAAWQSFFDAVGTVGHTEDRATQAPAGVEAQLKQEKIGLARADREAKERENALASGKLFNTEAAARELGELLALVKTELLKVAACAPLVRSKPDDASAEEYLRKEISAVLVALSESRVPSVAQAHARLRSAAT